MKNEEKFSEEKKAADDGELAKLSRFFHQISLTEWKKTEKKEFTLMNKKATKVTNMM